VIFSPPQLFQKWPTAVMSTSHVLNIFESPKVQEREKYFIPYFNKFRHKIIQNQPSNTTDNFKY